MKRFLSLALVALLAALPAQSQVPPGEGIVINQTPIQGGSSDQCLYKTTAGKVGAQACGTGTAADITVGTTTVTGAASGDLLTRGASALGKLTPGTGVNTALAVNVGTAGSFVVNGGNLGVPTISSVAWGSVPAAGTAGKMLRCSDCGTKGALLMDDGARWKGVNGQYLLKSLDVTSSNIANSETIVFQYQMPANLLQVGDRIRLFLNMAKSGTTDTGSVRFRVGTAGTTADAGVYSPTLISTSQRVAGVILDVRVESATSLQVLPNSFTGYGQAGTTALPSPVTISSTAANALYLNVGIFSGGAADTVALTGAQFWLVHGE